MRNCEHCNKGIQEDALFCPFCGAPVNTQTEIDVDQTESAKSERTENAFVNKQIPSKSIKKAVIIAAVFLVIVVVIYGEASIAKAKKYYTQGEYWKAFSAIEHVPTLGREELIRIKTAAFAGDHFSSYLTTKRIRLSSSSSRSRDAYQDAFWELMFGLRLDLRTVEQDALNDIKLSEYEKFIDLYYSELQTTFNMSKAEAKALVNKMGEDGNSVDDMKDICNNWLDDNFF